jgi:transcriptional regulator with XRE-family HTH domain
MDKNIIAQNLRKIRLDQKLTQKSVASMAGISYVAYNNIERGKSYPKDDTLKSIAEALNIAVADIWKQDGASKHIRFRCSPKMISRGKVLLDVEKWLEAQAGIEKNLTPVFEQDFIDVAKKATTQIRQAKDSNVKKASLAASIIRKEWELGEYPIFTLGKLLMDKGVKVYGYNLRSELFASLSISQKSGGPAIVVNAWRELAVESTVFNAAKELGHLILHPESYDVLAINECREEAREAWDFACEFLMPTGDFARRWNCYVKMGLKEAILRLKRVYGVSWKLVVERYLSLVRADFKVEEARYDGIWEEAKEALASMKLQYADVSEPYPMVVADFWGTEEPAELMARHLEAQCLKSGKSFRVLGRILKDYEGVDLTKAQERRKYLIGG